jgi:hypothetical protein
MATQHTLLSFIARYHTNMREDVATDALSFILSHSEAAQEALSEFLSSEESGPLSIDKVESRVTIASGAIPDLRCLDKNNGLVAVIESKFYADLTNNQPVAYWNELPADTPSVLLVVAPEGRADYLWNQLVTRLRSAGHELGMVQRTDDLITTTALGGQRRLMLTNWKTLLDRIAQNAWAERDWRASFEIAELQGLADNIIAGDDPQSDAGLKRLIGSAIVRVRQSGWANTTGLGVGQLAAHYYGRYLHLAGNFAWLGIEYKALQQMRDKPLWLLFFHRDYNRLDDSELRSRLEGLMSRLDWRANTVCVPIELTTGADSQATLNSVVDQLEHIGSLIDPDGPTYKKDSPDA